MAVWDSSTDTWVDDPSYTGGYDGSTPTGDWGPDGPTGSVNTYSLDNLPGLSSLLKFLPGGSGTMAQQLLGLTGISALANQLMGNRTPDQGFKGGIPNYTASRTMNAIPTTVFAPDGIHGIPRRPGSGGITYFTPMQYTAGAPGAANDVVAPTPAPATAIPTPVTPAPDASTDQSTWGAAAGGLASIPRYAAGGRLLAGGGDGVSDDIPATIGDTQPARLADGEYVVSARIVSELGNGSTAAGAKRLDAMMARIQRARAKTMGKDSYAVDSKAYKHLPA